MLEIETIVVTPFMQNARILRCSETNECVIVDPGGESGRILKTLERLGGTCRQIWLTHSHLDHCGGVDPIISATQAPLVAHPLEGPMRARVLEIASMYGLPADGWFNCPEPALEIQGGEVLTVGTHEARVLFTPGHSPGHVSFYFEKLGIILSGDVLFAGGIGRTDLPGGNFEVLMGSIKSQILSLPSETRVLSGHGGETTVGAEARSNPFIR